MPYCFRIRFEFSPRTRIKSDETEIRIPDKAEGKEILLKAGQDKSTLSEAKSLVLRGRYFDTEADAERAAEHWMIVLKKSFARTYIGADFGTQPPRSGVTDYGLALLSQEAGGGRFLDDIHGISSFECEPPPTFVRVGQSQIIIGPDVAHLLAAIDEAAELGVDMSARERLAYDLYSASFSEPSEDARFMMLMMAVETLIEPSPRPDAVRVHVEGLIDGTRASDLPQDQIKSIVSSLEWLRNESIGQAGRKLAERLGDRTYMDDPESAVQFFSKCYTLRSALAHGADPRPPWDAVGIRAASLEHFVADLLTLEFGSRS
ncbi:MAG TPA: hypothetical protein VGI73_10710 [Solirubrobacterales bacterium]